MKTDNQTKTLAFLNKIVLGIMGVSIVVWLIGQNPDITEAAKLLMFTMALASLSIQNVIYKYEIEKDNEKFDYYAKVMNVARQEHEDLKKLYKKAENLNEDRGIKLDAAYAKNNDLNIELQTWKELADYAAKIEFESDKKFAADRIREMLESKFNKENK